MFAVPCRACRNVVALNLLDPRFWGRFRVAGAKGASPVPRSLTGDLAFCAWDDRGTAQSGLGPGPPTMLPREVIHGRMAAVMSDWGDGAMSQAIRVILTAGCIAAFMIGAFPPRRAIYTGREIYDSQPVDRQFLYSSDINRSISQKRTSPAEVDVGRLLAELTLIAAITGLAVVLATDARPTA